jgi:hypothetical protein
VTAIMTKCTAWDGALDRGHPDWCDPRHCSTDEMSGERYHESRAIRIGPQEMSLTRGDWDRTTKVMLAGYPDLEILTPAEARQWAQRYVRIAEELTRLADVGEAEKSRQRQLRQRD